MRIGIIAVSAMAAIGLAGCQPKNGGAAWAPHGTGRYAGIGVDPTGMQWSKIAVSSRSQDPAAARTSDDEHVIVVVDSQTGEIRQCGNLSGYCIGLNPWSKALGSSETEPVRLTAHASSAEPARPAPGESAARPGGHGSRPVSGAAAVAP